MSKENNNHLFSKLIQIMDRLRGPSGCPWDKRQSHKSLLPYLFSEANEVKSAVRKQDWKNLEEELGDILLQIVFHCQIAKEKGIFDISDVIRSINQKLIRRHPHVFSGKKIKNSKDLLRQWEQIKRKEKNCSINKIKPKE